VRKRARCTGAYRLAFDLSRDEDPALAANAASNAALAAYASTAELSDELNHPLLNNRTRRIWSGASRRALVIAEDE